LDLSISEFLLTMNSRLKVDAKKKEFLAILLVLLTIPSVLFQNLKSQPPQFWLVIFKLEVTGEVRPTPQAEAELNFKLEAEWSGFLEEDGLDFIIYHLWSYPLRWEISDLKHLWIREVPPPEFKIDYVEGKETELFFYFSLIPRVISFDASSSETTTPLVLPSLPWSSPAPEKAVFKKKIVGQGSVSLPRSLLTNQKLERTFSWKEEIISADSSLKPVFQNNLIKIVLKIVKSSLELV